MSFSRAESLMLAMAGLLLFSLTAMAQSAPASPSKPLSSRHAAHRHARHAAKTKEEPVVAAPAAQLPVPPAQQAAHPATVVFRNGILRIDAANSSLVQIVNEVAHQTGMTVDGLSQDERVYGQYGPGPVSNTLAKLLDGAGYGYILIGGGNGAAPTKLMLTAKSDVPAGAPAMNSSAPQPSAGESAAPANPSEPVHAKTPQEIFDELRGLHRPK